MMEKNKETLMNMNTNHFNTMRDMLSEIERKIMHLDPLRQLEFYQPIQTMIFMAWEDACNPNDSFLTNPDATKS